MKLYIDKSTFMLPYTNQEAAAMSRNKFKHFKSTIYGGTRTVATHFIHSMVVSAKLLMASISSCINGFFPSAFRYTTASICLSIIEDDLQNNRMPIPQKQKQTTLNEHELNDISMPLSDDKTE